MAKVIIRHRLKFLLSHPAHVIACGWGSGLPRIAPGTVGTLFAWLMYPLLRLYFSEIDFLIFLAISFLIGVWACHQTGLHLGVADHGSIVWDEIVAFWLILVMIPASMGWQTAAFFLFRIFDITKPPLARWFDQTQKNGWGVMMDDIVAAFYTLLCLALWKKLFF